MALCPAFDPGAPYVAAMLALADCQSQGIAEDGWRALAGGFGPALTALLTIAVALLGYRLMLGERLDPPRAATLMLRIAVVLALCTQWSAWDALAFRIGTQEPAALAATVLAPGGLGGGDGAAITARFDRLDDQIGAIAAIVAAPAAVAGSPDATPAAPPPTMALLSTEDQHQLLSARRIITVTALAGLIAVRAALALLLALGPLFAASLLFAQTQSFFAGWLRAMAGAILAAVAIPMMLALELAVVEPQVGALAALLDAAQPPGDAVVRLWETAGVFALALPALVLALARAASALRLPVRADAARARITAARIAGEWPAP
ncbi:MAG: type IV secretion system protein, partial [Sphingomonadales bacterium]|nr:type IV secretion system protein [Sphingomonadales bacterium]